MAYAPYWLIPKAVPPAGALEREARARVRHGKCMLESPIVAVHSL